VLASYANLNVIYLHANRIRKLTTAQCLVDLPKLRSLTLHGNPCEQQAHVLSYAYIDTHTHTHTHAQHIHTHTYTCIYIYIYVYVYRV
jgi:hypothetical protein